MKFILPAAVIMFCIVLISVGRCYFGWEAGEIAQCAQFVAIVVGVVGTLEKVGKGQRATQARFLKVLIGSFNSASLQHFYNSIDHDIDEKTYGNVRDEARKTFMFFSYLYHAKCVRLIEDEDFKFFEGPMKKVLRNKWARQFLEEESKQGMYRRLYDYVCSDDHNGD